MLDGKVCVVTGAASKRGIGRATAALFARHGARCVILDLNEAESAAAAKELGEGHLGFACDVRDKAACESAAQRVLAELGRCDVLVNNAGISQPLRIMDIPPEKYDAVMDVNLRGALYMSQAFIPHMRERRQGSIICIGSVAGQRGGGIFGGPHYAASKAGIMGLAKAMARELGPDGVRVNSVAPGLIDTDITEGKIVGDVLASLMKAVPLNRVGQPSDIAGACLFLASDLSSYITGAVIDVNGGMLIH